MKNFILFLIVFSVSASQKVFSKDSITISGKLINNTHFVKVVVQKFGIGVFDIAATEIDKVSGKFSIVAPEDIEPGIYRFRYSQTGYVDYVDIIINGKEKKIEFTVDVDQKSDIRLPNFILSDENKAWYSYLKKQKELRFEIKVKQDFLINYPNKLDRTYLNMEKEYNKSKQNFLQFCHNFIDKTPFYWAKKKALFDKFYFPDLKEHAKIQDFYAHEAFWTNKPTTDYLLINTPLYTDAILDYLQYYLNPEMGFSDEEQNQGFIKCVDKIIEVYGGNDKTKEFAIKYLQLGFKEIGNEIILQYIDEKYAKNLFCNNEDLDLKKRLESYNTIKQGKQAPNIILTEIDGKEKSLLDFKQKTIVLTFWASWCPHCMNEMPNLQKWAKENPDTLVLAISLDNDYALFQKTIKNFPNLLHYCDLQMWDGIIAKDYYIVATPTIFEIDSERKINAKFSSIKNFIDSKN